MAKRRGDVRLRNGSGAAERPARTPKPATLEDLAAVRDELRRLDVQRAALLGRRDVLVQDLRSRGASWRDLEVHSGATRPALLKRGAGGLLVST